MEFLHTLWHAVEHTLLDTLPVLPFLYLCYLFLEFLERRVVSSEAVTERLKHTKLGPLVGGLFGMIPQCGFSAAASGLFAGRIISIGTLLAVFLSTSDEMMPLFVAGGLPPLFIILTVLLKGLIAVLLGFLFDLLFFRCEHDEGHCEHEVEELCARDGCGCENHNIFYAAAYHAARFFLFILLISFALTLAIEFIGEETLGSLVINMPVVGNLLATAVGLIPNCAASVALTELYLHGALSYGALFSGLLTGAGVGLLILFRVNRPMKQNLFVLLLLVLSGIGVGVLMDLLGVESLLYAIGG